MPATRCPYCEAEVSPSDNFCRSCTHFFSFADGPEPDGERVYQKVLHEALTNDGVIDGNERGMLDVLATELGLSESTCQQLEADVRARMPADGPDHADSAIAKHRAQIDRDVESIDAYHALQRIYRSTQRFDQAFCVCATLRFLNRATDDELRFFEQHQRRGFVRATARMTDALWMRCLWHEQSDVYISAIMGTIAAAVESMTAKPHKRFGLKYRHRRDRATDTLLFSKVFNYTLAVLDLRLADIFLAPDSPWELRMAHTTQAPSYVVGQKLLQGRPERELAFVVAKELSYLRPEFFLCRILPAFSEQQIALHAAAKLCEPRFASPDEHAVDALVAKLRDRLSPQIIEVLAPVVTRWLERDAKQPLERWRRLVDMTANRVGLLVCGDLQVAATQVASLECGPNSSMTKQPLSANGQVADLIRYSISDRYFEARSALGFSISA
jgi:hypothetical protein